MNVFIPANFTSNLKDIDGNLLQSSSFSFSFNKYLPGYSIELIGKEIPKLVDS
jgi:hypothetical protein